MKGLLNFVYFPNHRERGCGCFTDPSGDCRSLGRISRMTKRASGSWSCRTRRNKGKPMYFALSFDLPRINGPPLFKSRKCRTLRESTSLVRDRRKSLFLNTRSLLNPLSSKGVSLSWADCFILEPDYKKGSASKISGYILTSTNFQTLFYPFPPSLTLTYKPDLQVKSKRLNSTPNTS